MDQITSLIDFHYRLQAYIGEDVDALSGEVYDTPVYT